MNWQHEIAKLRDHARAVHAYAAPTQGMQAREVARVLSGVTSIVARRSSVYEMQRACAMLVLDDKALSSRLTALPRGPDGMIDPSIEMIAVVARGILSASSIEAVKSALAFWASEGDPAVWQSVVLAAA